MKKQGPNKTKQMLSSILLSFVALLLAGCDTFAINPSIKLEHKDQVKNIGIVNVLNSTFQGIHIGTTIFNNKYYEADVSDWKINQTMSDTTKTYIENATPYTATIVDLSEEERLSLLEKGNHLRPKIDEILALCKTKGLDTMIIFRGVYYENEPFHRSPYGYYSRKIFNITDKDIYSLFILDVYDVPTGKNISWHWGYPNGPEPSGIEWKADFSEFTEAEKEVLKQTLVSQVNGSITTALQKVFQNARNAPAPIGE